MPDGTILAILVLGIRSQLETTLGRDDTLIRYLNKMEKNGNPLIMAAIAVGGAPTSATLISTYKFEYPIMRSIRASIKVQTIPSLVQAWLQPWRAQVLMPLWETVQRPEGSVEMPGGFAGMLRAKAGSFGKQPLVTEPRRAVPSSYVSTNSYWEAISSTLPVGTPVNLSLSLHFDGMLKRRR